MLKIEYPELNCLSTIHIAHMFWVSQFQIVDALTNMKTFQILVINILASLEYK